MTTKPLQIAIDGPVGSGKSYIAQQVAKELSLVYIYTGAMYRALALLCLREHIAFKDKDRVLPLLERYNITLAEPRPESTRAFSVKVNEEDVTELLFNPEIDQGTSDVSTIPEVRRFMVTRQQEMAEGKRVILEGRDIGVRVLPDADIKIYLTASVEERARRRCAQFEKKGIVKKYEEVLRDTKVRDQQDMSRDADPLTLLPDAWQLDTTGMTKEQVVQTIIEELKRRNLI